MREPELAPMIMTALKKLMRTKGVNYRDLAKRLRKSESGIKKLMTNSDCSIGRLEQICHALNIELTDVIHSLKRDEVKGVAYTAAQEEYFLENRRAFLFYWMLVYERRTQEESKKLLQFSDAVATKTLVQLDRLSLLQFLPSGEVRTPKPVAIKWIRNSDFVKKIFREWTALLMQRVARPDTGENEYFEFHAVRMSEKTWNEFILALKEIEAVFVNKAVREMRIDTDKLKFARWIFAADRRSFAEEELL